MKAEQLIAVVSVTFLLVGIVAAFAALVLWRKQPRRPRPRLEQEWPWNGLVFDARAVSSRVQQVRNDHLAALHRRPRPIFHPATLLEAARKLVAGLAYFRGLGAKCATEAEHGSRSAQPKEATRL
jgi:hypothetical protein